MLIAWILIDWLLASLGRRTIAVRLNGWAAGQPEPPSAANTALAEARDMPPRAHPKKPMSASEVGLRGVPRIYEVEQLRFVCEVAQELLRACAPADDLLPEWAEAQEMQADKLDLMAASPALWATAGRAMSQGMLRLSCSVSDVPDGRRIWYFYGSLDEVQAEVTVLTSGLVGWVDCAQERGSLHSGLYLGSADIFLIDGLCGGATTLTVVSRHAFVNCLNDGVRQLLEGLGVALNPSHALGNAGQQPAIQPLP